MSDDQPSKVTPLWKGALLYRESERGRTLLDVTANAVTILAHDERWTGVLTWDAFGLAIRTGRRPPWHPDDAPGRPWTADDEWTDADTVRVQAWLQRRYRLKLGLDAVWNAVRLAAELRTVHPVRDWLESLEWDGVRRLPTWLPTYLGGEASAYAELVGPWTLIGAVARVYRPGCKLDTMLILEGPQGARKSSALRALFSPWFSDTPLDLESKDRFGAIRGVWGVELAELDSFRRADANRIKSFLSSPTDRYRPPYGRADITVPRSAIFLGSTNADEYLTDPTGGRRFWPWRCGTIRLAELERDRTLLWAEAREAFRGGAAWYPAPEQFATLSAEQEARAQLDVWQDVVDGWLAERPPGAWVTVADVLKGAIGSERGRWGQGEMTRVARCLREAGWERKRLPREKGSRGWGYRRPSGTGGPQWDQKPSTIPPAEVAGPTGPT